MTYADGTPVEVGDTFGHAPGARTRTLLPGESAVVLAVVPGDVCNLVAGKLRLLVEPGPHPGGEFTLSISAPLKVTVDPISATSSECVLIRRAGK